MKTNRKDAAVLVAFFVFAVVLATFCSYPLCFLSDLPPLGGGIRGFPMTTLVGTIMNLVLFGAFYFGVKGISSSIESLIERGRSHAMAHDAGTRARHRAAVAGRKGDGQPCQ